MKDQKINLDKIEHRGEIRIAVTFPFHQENINKIKSIPGYRWSQTKKCWHIPYTPQAFRALKAIFGEVIIVYPESIQRSNPKFRRSDSGFEKEQNPITNQYQQEEQYNSNQVLELSIENDYRLKAKVPYYKKDWIKVIKNIPGFAWNPKLKYWSIPYVQFTIDHLRRYIGPY